MQLIDTTTTISFFLSNSLYCCCTWAKRNKKWPIRDFYIYGRQKLIWTEYTSADDCSFRKQL